MFASLLYDLCWRQIWLEVAFYDLKGRASMALVVPVTFGCMQSKKITNMAWHSLFDASALYLNTLNYDLNIMLVGQNFFAYATDSVTLI